jgi:hypothetical protein
MVVKNILAGISNAQQLLLSPERLRNIFKDIGLKTWGEIKETGDMLEILWKLSLNMDVSQEEKERAYEQAKDLAKTIPAFGIFLLPGGMVLLPLLAKIVPWEILPSQFAQGKKDKEKSDKTEES